MDTEKLIKELIFKAVRSSGPGGQHVNKTASKVEVNFNIKDSLALSRNEKEKLFDTLSTKLTSEGILRLSCSETRSQHRNKAIIIDRLLELLKIKLRKVKPRKKTKPSKSAIEQRLVTKKKQALKKATRRPPEID